MLVSLEISNRDAGYSWFLSWMAETQKEQKGTAARWSRSPQLSLQTSVHQVREHATPDVAFSFVAGLGNHYFQYRGAWFQVHREREVKGGSMLQGPVWETLTTTKSASLTFKAERGLTDDRLNHVLSSLPDRSILLMEDVDAAFNKRIQVTEDGLPSPSPVS